MKSKDLRKAIPFVYAVLLIVVVLTISYVYRHYMRQAVPVKRDVLFGIIKPGVYNGKGHYTATEMYPNGLNTDLRLDMKETSSGTSYVVDITAYDAKTGEHAYTGQRTGRFDYKESHGLDVFRNTASYIDGKLVSSSHGRVIGATSNSLRVLANGSWHISPKQHQMIVDITRSGNKLRVVHYNDSAIPFVNYNTMTEEYTMV